MAGFVIPIVIGLAALFVRCGGKKEDKDPCKSNNPTIRKLNCFDPCDDRMRIYPLPPGVVCPKKPSPPSSPPPPPKTYDEKVQEYNNRCGDSNIRQAILDNIGRGYACGVGENYWLHRESSYSLKTPTEKEEKLLDDLNANQQCLVSCRWTMNWSTDPKTPRKIQCSVEIKTDNDGKISSAKNTSDPQKNPGDGDPNYECRLRSQYRAPD